MKVIVTDGAGSGAAVTDALSGLDASLSGLTVDTTTLVVDATNNRVGIGTSSPTDALHVLDSSGNAYASIARDTQSQGEVGLRLRGGTSGNDWYVYQKTSSNNLNFYNTADRLTIDSSGNLGLGLVPNAWSVGRALELGFEGNALWGNAADEVIVVQNAYYNSGWKYATTRPATHYSQYNGGHRWFTAPSGTADAALSWTQAMTLSSSGSVGIGTTDTNSHRAAIDSGAGTSLGLMHKSSNSFSLMTFKASGTTQDIRLGVTGNDLLFQTNATERMRITSAGTVKISHADTASEGFRVIQTTGGRTSGGALGLFYDDQAGTTQPTLVAQQNGTGDILQLFDGASQVVTVKDGGTLLVGNTGLTSARTSIYNSGVDALRVALSDNAASSTSFIAGFSDSSTSGYGSLRFKIVANGNMTNSNNSYGALSDEKLKENITDATPKLDSLNQVRVVNYNLISDPENKQLGVIAQELEQIFPNMVDEFPDKDNNGNDLGTTTKTVKYSVFVPMLIKAIQEQQTTITALTARIEQLENN